MNSIKEGTDFKFVEKSVSDFYSIKLLSGTWADTIFTFGKVSITEDKNEDFATLSFDYRIEESPRFTEDELLESDSFKGHLGDILTTLLEDHAAKIGNAPHGTEPTSNDT